MAKNKLKLYIFLSLLPVVCIAFALMIIFGGALFTGQETTSSGGGCSPSGSVDQNKWNAGFEKAGVFKGKQDVFLSLAEEQGIDPVLFASIAMSETGWGSSNAVKMKNNPGGLMDTATGMATVKTFATLDDGLAAMAQTLHNRIVVDGLDTIEKLGAVYAPIGASNDPTNLNANWVPTVYSIAENFGGLSKNCTAGTSADVQVVGDKISYFDSVMREATKYEGWVYTWGGSTPEVGFDCSGLVQWTFKKSGVSLPRTATAQYSATQRIEAKDVKAGDLIFFKGTYGGVNHISHVGIVVNETKMFDSNSSGIGYHNYSAGYWKQHFAGFGRVKP
ncbi:hypothetical protein FQR52_14865 [Listeria monocytogenes]|nr:hypothetical protein [Listeria monocytogenes]